MSGASAAVRTSCRGTMTARCDSSRDTGWSGERRQCASLVGSCAVAREEWGSGVGTLSFLLRAEMFQLLFDLGDYATTYRATRDAYLKAG